LALVAAGGQLPATHPLAQLPAALAPVWQIPVGHAAGAAGPLPPAAISAGGGPVIADVAGLVTACTGTYCTAGVIADGDAACGTARYCTGAPGEPTAYV